MIGAMNDLVNSCDTWEQNRDIPFLYLRHSLPYSAYTHPISICKAFMLCRAVFKSNVPTSKAYCQKVKDIKGIFQYQSTVIILSVRHVETAIDL
jgi:hypothetical protein